MSVKTGGGASTPVTFSQLPADVCCQVLVTGHQCGRVRGLDNLRVADASIMANIPRANTNLTCIMIGERIAEWMRAE